MKKSIVALVVAVTMAMSLVACSGSSGEDGSGC